MMHIKPSLTSKTELAMQHHLNSLCNFSIAVFVISIFTVRCQDISVISKAAPNCSKGKHCYLELCVIITFTSKTKVGLHYNNNNMQPKSFKQSVIFLSSKFRLAAYLYRNIKQLCWNLFANLFILPSSTILLVLVLLLETSWNDVHWLHHRRREKYGAIYSTTNTPVVSLGWCNKTPDDKTG